RCDAFSCNDGQTNGNETDVDCGGPDCPACKVAKTCSSDADCRSGICNGSTCGVCRNGKNRTQNDACGFKNRGDLTQVCQAGKWTKKSCKGDFFRNCNEIASARPGAGSGSYQIDPDGSGGRPAFDVYCDMSTAGGGWTLIAKISANDGNDRWLWSADLYRNRKTLGTATNLAAKDAKSRAYSEVEGTHLLIRDLNRNAHAAHPYVKKSTAWRAYVDSIWRKCEFPISKNPIALDDDGRDSVIGPELYFRHNDPISGPSDCVYGSPNRVGIERAMFSEFPQNNSYNDAGIGLTGGNARYRDAQSGDPGSHKLGHNQSQRHEDYALFVR
ncbi:MAG: fibrinogen-like YCDxxxxGGGW domain-containing protein, partial [Bradymonadaceae bacterium]